MSERRTIDLPREHAAFLDAQVSSGAYASESAVVEAGLEALRAHEASLDHWLRNDAANAYDAMQADPARAIPAAAVFAELRARHAERFKD